MMPGMDGFEVCRRLKSEPRTATSPVIMVTALDQPSDSVRGLEAGADDFLTKPVDDIALMKRVRNLARLKMLTDEMLMRASTEEQMGFAGDRAQPSTTALARGRILVVEDQERSAERIVEALQAEHSSRAHETDPARALLRLADEQFRSDDRQPSLEHADGLRLCSQVRSHRPRHGICRCLCSPSPATRRGCCAGSISASTTISSGPSMPTSCWHGCARKSSASAMSIICGCGSSRASRWRFSIRSRRCITAAT